VSFVAISLFGHTHGEMQSCVQNDDRHWKWWVVVFVRFQQALRLLGFSLYSWWDYYSSSIKLMVNLCHYSSSIKLMVHIGHYSSSIKLMVHLGHSSSSIKLMVTIIVHLSSFKVDFVSWWFLFSNFFLMHKIHGQLCPLTMYKRWFLSISNFLFLKKSILSTKLGFYFGMHW
jgi:hypothetical protein